MKRNKKKVHRGKPVYTFQGVDYLARRDTSRCLGVCRKHKNGRYYMTVSDYEESRKALWKFIFRQRVYSVIRRQKERRSRWYSLVESVLHKQRFLTLLNHLKQSSFAKLLINSRLYAKAKEKALLKRTCFKCGSTDTNVDPRAGPCRCHLCEDWFGCNSNSGRDCPDQLVCRQCGYRQNLPGELQYYPAFSYLGIQ